MQLYFHRYIQAASFKEFILLNAPYHSLTSTILNVLHIYEAFLRRCKLRACCEYNFAQVEIWPKCEQIRNKIKDSANGKIVHLFCVIVVLSYVSEMFDGCNCSSCEQIPNMWSRFPIIRKRKLAIYKNYLFLFKQPNEVHLINIF